MIAWKLSSCPTYTPGINDIKVKSVIECVKYIGRGRLWFGSAKPLPGQRVRCKSQKSLYEFCLSSRVKMERTVEPGDHLALQTWEGSHKLYYWAPAGQSVITAHQRHVPCQHPTYPEKRITPVDPQMKAMISLYGEWYRIEEEERE